MFEEWKEIEDSNGLYFVSTLGRIKSFNRYNYGIILKQRLDKDGYLRVNMSFKEKKVNRAVHRLVAEAFIPKPLFCNEVNHLDFDRKNNKVNNLEWVTHRQNIAYSKKHKRFKKIR